MRSRNLLLGWIWALQLTLACAHDINNWEQIITVASTQFSLPPRFQNAIHLSPVVFALRFDFIWSDANTKAQKTEKDCINVWTQDPSLSLQDPQNIKPTAICPGDAFYTYDYRIWITSGFLHTHGKERLVPKFQDSFKFPLGTSTATFDSNFCLVALPDLTKQCAQFCNPGTAIPELNPYWLKRYDEGLNRDAATDALSDAFIAAKSCKQQEQQQKKQRGDQQPNNIQSSEDLLEQQGQALTGENSYFPTTASPSNYFPLAGSPLRDLFSDDLTDFDTSQHDSKSGPILVDTVIDGPGSGSGSPTPNVSTGLRIRRNRVEKLRAQWNVYKGGAA